jgi:xanthine dehydrogenase YagR molybdenum-binding subunit
MNERTIGTSMRRVDGRLKVTGTALYTADQRAPNLVHAYGVFSTVASGLVTRIDTTVARDTPGVIDIFHHEHCPRLYGVRKMPISATGILTLSLTDENRAPFEVANVHYAGQFVAVVVADTFEHAREAAYKVNVQYAPGKPVANLKQGLAAGGTRPGCPDCLRGTPEPAFDSATHKIDVTYTTPVETHNPMEMHATVAKWTGDELHLYEATQGVTVHRNTIAKIFGMTPDQVTVEAPFIGSGFGSKLWLWPHSVVASAAAREVGRTVKLVVPRAQMFTATGNRPETQQRLRLGADASGKLTSLSHESVNSTSFTDEYIENCGGVSKSLYSCPNVLVSHAMTRVNLGAPTSMRAPGAAPGLFALESAIDELALTAHIDPLQFRLQNIAERDESANLPWSSNHLREAMQTAGDRFGWGKRDPCVGSMREGNEVIGYGMAACNWEAYRTPSEAPVQLRSDGTASLKCAIQDIGTGTYTIAAQVVADLTGLPVERIQVKLGDSSFPSALGGDNG